jgi:hypothetical protein
MKDNVLLNGLLIVVAFAGTILVINFFKISIHGDFEQMLLPIISGTCVGIFSKGEGKEKFKKSIKSISIGTIILIIIYLLVPNTEDDIYTGFGGFMYIFILGICPVIACMVFCSMFCIFDILPFIEKFKDKNKI